MFGTRNDVAPQIYGSHYLARGITDLWMLEIAERNGEIWISELHWCRLL